MAATAVTRWIDYQCLAICDYIVFSYQPLQDLSFI